MIDFKIGADPEFLVIDGSKIIYALDYNDISCKQGVFGVDGNGYNCEIRPRPSYNPLKVVDNIHKIFLTKVNNIPKFSDYEWRAGSYFKYPLGGHIHFGIAGLKDPNQEDDIQYQSRRLKNDNICNVLDDYLGSISILLEKPNEALSRRNRTPSYGFKSDNRDPAYGLEYRVCSSWLTSPYIASAMLCLAKTIVFDYFNKGLKAKNLFDETNFRYAERKIFKSRYDEIWQDIQKMHLYPLYKSYLDLINFLISNNLSWFPSIPMKEAWGVYYHQVKDEDVTLDSIWSKHDSI